MSTYKQQKQLLLTFRSIQNSDLESVTLGLTFGIGFRPTSGRRRHRRHGHRHRPPPRSGKSSRTEFMNQDAKLTKLCVY